MSKYYLVRRNLESFLGPLTVEELKLAYQRMEFGLQDEVSGHCGLWIALDDVERLKKNYPEIARVVVDEMLGGWGVSQHPVAATIRPARISDARRDQNKRWLTWFTLLMCAVAIVGGAFALKSTKLASRFFGPDLGYSEDQVNEAFLARNWSAFDAMINAMMPELVSQSARSRVFYQQWIPYLRAYAFRHDGAIDGLKPKMLRGLGNLSAPNDCSFNIMRDKFLAAADSLVDIFSGKAFPQQEHLRVIFYDPHWIKHRPTAGWKIPSNYYEACVAMGIRAASEIKQSAPVHAKTMTILQNRLALVFNIANGISTPSDTDAPAFVNALNCIDSAEDGKTLVTCLASATEFSKQAQEYLVSRQAMAGLRIMLKGQTQLDEAAIVQLTQLYNLFHNDEVSKLDYQPELKYIRFIMSSSGNIQSALGKVREEFPDVELKNL